MSDYGHDWSYEDIFNGRKGNEKLNVKWVKRNIITPYSMEQYNSGNLKYFSLFKSSKDFRNYLINLFDSILNNTYNFNLTSDDYMREWQINLDLEDNSIENIGRIEDAKQKYMDIIETIKDINIQAKWNFNLIELEPLQYTIYNLRNFYDWHIDSHIKPYDNGLIRKLSFTICLNDDELENNNYTGGDFEICLPHPYHNKNKYFRFRKVFKQGTIIVFPSHIWHKVHPVTSGTRKVLVGWVVGKSFE